MPNGQESDLGLDPFFDDRTLDPDADGRNNAQEILAGTNPNDPDSDDDGLNDGAEFTGGTNPLLADTDGDGIGDRTDRRPLIANVAPTPRNDAAAVRPNESTQFPEATFLANDTDPDGDQLRVDFNFQPTVLHGTAFYTSVPGLFGYTPNAGFSGADTLTYRVVDEGGLTATASVAITVGDNTRPVAGTFIAAGDFRSEYSVVQDAMTPLVLSGSDSDGNALTARLKSLPAQGRLFQRAIGGGPGNEITQAPAIISDAGRLVFYQPAAGFVGDDSFAYTVHDGIDESNPALALLHIATSIPPQSNDVWDISQGTVVTSSTGFVPNSTGDNMFGRSFGVEPGNAIFADGRPAGFTHAVEWRTSGLLLLEGARIFATQGGDTSGQRTFTEMRLFGRTDAAAAFTQLATFRPGENPYFSPVRATVFFAPFVGQEFRAEFDQFGNFTFPGPRIEELDGIGEPVVLVPVECGFSKILRRNFHQLQA